MQPCLLESPEGAKSNLQFSLLGITVGLGWSQWTPDSLLIRQDDDNVRELNIDTEEEGLPQSNSSTILRSCFSFLHHWSLGGGAAIYKWEWVGGMGLSDTKKKEKFPGKSWGTSLSTNHIQFYEFTIYWGGTGIGRAWTFPTGKRGENGGRNVSHLWFMLNRVLTPQGMEVPESLMIPPSSQATWGKSWHCNVPSLIWNFYQIMCWDFPFCIHER